MDHIGLTQRDMIPHLGRRSNVSEVLSGKRPLIFKMIRAIHKHIGIPADNLIEEPSHVPGSNLGSTKFPLAEMVKGGVQDRKRQKGDLSFSPFLPRIGRDGEPVFCV
jgi:HTH-type transcriptional regulator / antitoxin HigA